MSSDIDGKLMTAAEAVRKFVPPGALVALGGFTVNRNPMLLAREIIRQGIGDLHLACHSQGQSMDMLIGAGMVKRLEIAYGGMGRFAPTCIRFKRMAEAGKLEVEDYTNYQMSLRFLAGGLGLPFIPTRTGRMTDVAAREGFSPETRRNSKAACRKLAELDNPFGPEGDKVICLPALNPDVALIHVQTVGEDGTARIKGLTFADLEQAKAAKRLVVSCEEIVPWKELREDPDQNCFPAFMVDAVVLAPYGAHPTACHRFYDYDPAHLKQYGRLAADETGFREYLDEWVFGIPTHEDYLNRLGDIKDLLRADPAKGYAPGLDRR